MLTQQILQSSNAATLLSTPEEDIAGETDEPPDSRSTKYSKVTVRRAAPQSSLLTQALSSPEMAPIDRGRSRESISFWSLSGASTAELTSDGGLSSPSHSPSTPPPPNMLRSFGRIMFQKGSVSQQPLQFPGSVHVVGEDDALDGLARRRCIRFACHAEAPSRRGSSDDISDHNKPTEQAHKTSTTIRFATTFQAPQKSRKRIAHTPSPTMLCMPSKLTPEPTPTPRASNSATRFHEFASSCDETESWMVQVPDKTRLLRVDGVLEKENDIRKLSEEVEAEAKQEEEEAELEQLDEDEEDDEGSDDEFDSWEEDEEEDEDEEDEDEDDDDNEDVGDEEYLSGNESDNEEGFASDSDDSDSSFFNYPRRSGYPLPLLHKPMDGHKMTFPTFTSFNLPNITQQHPSTIELPDSTDFVCGTFDEDKALEDAYASALNEQKRAKHGITPQDIDPSFPTSESDSEEEYYVKSPGTPEHAWIRGGMSFSEEETHKARKLHSILTKDKAFPEGKIRFNSPVPHRRAHSPAPKRRMLSPPPVQKGSRVTPPVSRRNSNEHSPRPTILRRGSRALSPPPPTRNVSHLHFARGHIERTKSLPKTVKLSLKSFAINMEDAPQDATPFVIRPRGAIDIVKGLEKKRERRRNKLARQRGSFTRKGEGVEKMRELGLMLGKGKQAQWMISV